MDYTDHKATVNRTLPCLKSQLEKTNQVPNIAKDPFFLYIRNLETKRDTNLFAISLAVLAVLVLTAWNMTSKTPARNNLKLELPQTQVIDRSKLKP